MKASNPKVHIYPLSRLVSASPADWERQLQAIEEGKIGASGYYQPLRAAVVLYCKSRGRRYDDAVRDLEARARSVKAFKGADPVRDNRDAFDVFVRSFYPRIASFDKSLLNADDADCAFGAVALSGSPHCIVTDTKGAQRYVCLLASKWDDEDTKAYLELLGIIIKERYGAPPESLWCMDLRAGLDVRWKASPRLRARCEKTAALYARLVRAISAP